MSRHTGPVCHGRPMKHSSKLRQWVCARCGAWTTRLTGGTW
ncbi:hypothetical protein ACFWJQ_35590 [Streptomyces goshikiensis]